MRAGGHTRAATALRRVPLVAFWVMGAPEHDITTRKLTCMHKLPGLYTGTVCKAARIPAHGK